MPKDNGMSLLSKFLNLFSACNPFQTKDNNNSPQSTPTGSFRASFEGNPNAAVNIRNLNPNVIDGCFSNVANAIEKRREENMEKNLSCEQRCQLLAEFNDHKKAHPTRGFDITKWDPIRDQLDRRHPSESTSVSGHYRLYSQYVDEVTFI